MSNIPLIPPNDLYDQIRGILESARTEIARTVNTAQVLSNWLIDRAIVEDEQQGQQRADYGENLLKNLAQQLKQEFGAGYSYSNLKYMRQFYVVFPQLLDVAEISHALRDQSFPTAQLATLSSSTHNWQPGQLHRAADDNPTLGLILCSDKNDAMVKYTLGAEQQDQIFASRYKLHLPTEAELGRELSHLRSLMGDE